MKKRVVLCFCCIFSFITSSSAKNYPCDHFIIDSVLAPGYVQFIQANAEAYYQNLRQQYFLGGWKDPLLIYYSRTQSDTRKLLNEHGYKTEVDYGRYESEVPVIYTHQFLDNGGLTDWGAVFHEITHHFIRLNYNDPPAWFDEGLASFLGEQTGIVNKRIDVGRPNPRGEQILRDKIEQGLRPNIKRLFSLSNEQFYNWDLGCPFARAFFYWLHENGYLKDYLTNVREKGYELSVLEETVSQTYGKINVELLRFIRQHCYAGAYLQDSRQTEDQTQKEQTLLKALELKPDYKTARLELAQYYYHTKNYEKCRENLKQILDNPECIESRQAATLFAGIYYNQKNYSEAIEYYTQAWKYSDYYEYKYRLAYKLGNCYHHLKNYERAKEWYEKFLDCCWEPESMKTQTDYALKYIQCSDYETDAVQSKVRVKPPDKK